MPKNISYSQTLCWKTVYFAFRTLLSKPSQKSVALKVRLLSARLKPLLHFKGREFSFSFVGIRDLWRVDYTHFECPQWISPLSKKSIVKIVILPGSAQFSLGSLNYCRFVANGVQRERNQIYKSALFYC